ADTGIQISGPVTSWQVRRGNFLYEYLAGRSTSGELVVFYWSPANAGGKWQAQRTGQFIADTVVAWNVPNGSGVVEHLAGRNPNNELLVYGRGAAGAWNPVNVTARTGVAVAGGLTSWRTQLGPELVERLAATGTDGDLHAFAWQPSHDWHETDVTQVATGSKIT